jgi:hypothetical protein
MNDKSINKKREDIIHVLNDDPYCKYCNQYYDEEDKYIHKYKICVSCNKTNLKEMAKVVKQEIDKLK